MRTTRFLHRARVRWSLLALYVGLIYSTLYVIRRVQELLTGWLGDAVYWPVYLCLIGGGLLLALRILRNRRRGIRPMLWLIALAAGYGWGLYLLPVLAERVHFVEYGLLGLMAVWALALHAPNRAAYVAAVLVTYLGGVGDETIQWLLPNRVGEWRDLVLNGASGALAVAALALVWRPEGLDGNPTVRDRRLLAVLTTVAVTVTGMFQLAVHEYGHAHHLGDRAWTRSTIPPEEFRALGAGETGREASLEGWWPVYRQEGGDHFNMSRWYLDQDRLDEAAGEALLARDLYGPALEALELGWTAEELARMKGREPPAGARWESQWRSELIVGVRPWQVVLVWLPLLALSLGWTLRACKSDAGLPTVGRIH